MEQDNNEPESPTASEEDSASETERAEPSDLDGGELPADAEGEEAYDTIGDEADTMSDEELSEVIESLCLSKVEEFRMLGYEHVTGQDIWECVSDKYRKTGLPPLYQIVNDILSLKSTQFMNWMTLSVFKGAQL